MYPVLGNTGIGMYGLINKLALIAVIVYNFLNLKNKKLFPSNFSLFFIENKKNRNIPILLRSQTFWVIIETLFIVVFQQILIGAFNSIFGNIFGTGLNYFGLLFFSPLFLFLFFYIIGINPLKQMDLIVPAYPLALFFIKLACFFHGCCSGFECSWGYYNQQNFRFEFPSQLVEATWALLIFLCLFLYRKKTKEGTMYPLYLILYSSTRFLSEFTRLDSNILGPFKAYHFFCIAGVIFGLVGLFITSKYSEIIKQKFDRNPFPWIVDKNIIHHKKRNTTHGKSAYNKPDFSNLRMWTIIWTLGLIGQIGWNVEGAWFNTFVYEKIDKNPSIITAMLILSALATVISMFIFGTLTDRTGKRRTLISTGLILWGILTIAFGFTQYLATNALTSAIVSIVIIDMLLSFFGTMSTESGFSTWLTDIINEKNRGQIGGAIAIQSVLGSVIGNVLGGYIVGTSNNYLRLFIVAGSVFSIFGIVAIFLFNKTDDVEPFVSGSFLQQFLSIFDVKILLKHKELLLVNIAVAIFFTGYNAYHPHLGNYLIHYLGFSANKIGLIQVFPLVIAMLSTIPISGFINKNKFVEIGIFASVIGLIGITLVYNLSPTGVNTNSIFNYKLFTGILFVGISYIAMIQSTKIWVKLLYPKESKGQFEGIWAISFALIPMFLGSNIGESIIKNSGETVLNEISGRLEYIPNGKVFLIGSIVSALSIIPILLTKKYSKNHR